MSGLFAASSGAVGFITFLVIAAVTVFEIAALWQVFTKAGKPGWAAIIPIYNTIVLLEIVDKPIWWIILFFIPFVNIVAIILVYLELAKVYGRSSGFGIGLILLPYVFIPILGFGDARYQGARQQPAMA